ncbi:MAG: V-type ATP synthase subunit D [Ruminococcaceae bacterium]|nr:V-type ATP synthase subunit D [Oscillospiraceae bacterium]
MSVVPTKSNLMATKKSLDLSGVGYELLDRKRNILIREMMSLISKASQIQEKIDSTYASAYIALQRAQTVLGVCEPLAQSIPVEDGLRLSFRSVMGVELPTVTLDETDIGIPFGLSTSDSLLDDAYLKFVEVKKLTVELAEVENSVYRLADAIGRTQKRANALKNILIPKFEAEVKEITEALEEKEREEFSRMKVIKMQKK